MLCELIELRRDGLRLRPDEWPAPLVGDLQMDYSDGRQNNSRRTLRRLTLWQSDGGNTRRPGVPLIDPELIDVLGDALLFRGHMLAVQDTRIYEHEQLWLVRPRAARTGPHLPPFDPLRWAQRMPDAGELATGYPRA